MVKASNWVYKTITIGVIVLFICVGIQPAFAFNPNTLDSEEECNICPKINNLHLSRLKNLLNRVEKYDNIILSFFEGEAFLYLNNI